MKVPGCISVLIVLRAETLRLIHLIKPRWRTLSLHREVVSKKRIQTYTKRMQLNYRQFSVAISA